MMPDLPNMGLERDINGFTEFFENPAFRADGLKIYPTLVIRGTGREEIVLWCWPHIARALLCGRQHALRDGGCTRVGSHTILCFPPRPV